jgi:hypothetical protein
MGSGIRYPGLADAIEAANLSVRRATWVDCLAAVVGFGEEPGVAHHLKLVGLVPVVPVLVSLRRDPALRGKLPDTRDTPAKRSGCLAGVDAAL